MWCCPGLSGLSDWRQFWNQKNRFLSNFEKERENAKLPSLFAHLRASKWGFSLKSFTGQTPSFFLPQKLCNPNWSNQSAINSKRYIRGWIKSPTLQILSSDDMNKRWSAGYVHNNNNNKNNNKIETENIFITSSLLTYLYSIFNIQKRWLGL